MIMKENKINVAELLKDCPTGMELDCTIFDDVYFDYIDDVSDIIICYIQDSTKKIGISFSKYGCYSSISKSKCVIFPKGKTTWEGFQRPFKDGDVISDSLGTCIFKGKGMIQGTVDYYCGVHGDYFNVKWKPEGHYGDIVNYRFATEEEKSKLFQAIKDNGYKWDAETKTLDKLPKFKVGNKIKKKGIDYRLITIESINNNYYVIKTPDWFDNCYITSKLYFSNQDNYELVPNKFDVTTLKPFDKVLVRYKYSEWNATFFSHYDKEVNYGCYPFVTTSSKSYSMCIPYEGNEHLLGTTNDCDDFYKTWE